jgi:hypothetical protein
MNKFTDFTITEIKPHIFCAKFSNQYSLTSTFMRAQEFYESPLKGIRNNFFTVEQFMDKYAELKSNFSYTNDWSAFNLPGHVVDDFISIFSFDFTEKEKKLFLCIDKNRFVYKKYYLIGIYKEENLNHELAHAYFYLFEDYRKNVKKFVKELDKQTFNKLQKAFF